VTLVPAAKKKSLIIVKSESNLAGTCETHFLWARANPTPMQLRSSFGGANDSSHIGTNDAVKDVEINHI
jgi:hypothetical protein